MKPSQVIFLIKFSPTGLNFGYGFVLLVHFLGHPVVHKFNRIRWLTKHSYCRADRWGKYLLYTIQCQQYFTYSQSKSSKWSDRGIGRIIIQSLGFETQLEVLPSRWPQAKASAVSVWGSPLICPLKTMNSAILFSSFYTCPSNTPKFC